MRYAILIDGGFAKRRLGSKDQPATAEDFAALVDALAQHEALMGQRVYRIYYYDSVPLAGSETNPLSGERVNFGGQPVASRARQLFDKLIEQPFFALRLGELAFNGWGVKSYLLRKADEGRVEVTATDLVPQISQKGVDMRIGMDIAALSLKKLVQTIVLVTGDSDFVPAMKFARREGAQLYLVTLGQSVKPALHEHSDLRLTLDLPGRAGKVA